MARPANMDVSFTEKLVMALTPFQLILGMGDITTRTEAYRRLREVHGHGHPKYWSRNNRRTPTSKR